VADELVLEVVDVLTGQGAGRRPALGRDGLAVGVRTWNRGSRSRRDPGISSGPAKPMIRMASALA
jgi:hypothetical protein